MKPEPARIARRVFSRLAQPAVSLLFGAAIFLGSILGATAGSATWKAAPTDGNWSNSTNWTPKTVPNGASDTATFGSSSLTSIGISAPTEVASIVFQPGASAFSINDLPILGLTISGIGVVNNSGLTQTFIAAPGDYGAGDFNFTNTATAGSLIAFDIQGGTLSGEGGGFVQFFGNANAGQASFAIDGAHDLEGGAGSVIFFDSSSAAGATFSLGAGTGPASTVLQFRGASTAGSSTCSANGVVFFIESATAAAAQITLQGAPSQAEAPGVLLMFNNTSAANAAIVALGGGAEGTSGAAIFFSDFSTAANCTLIANGDRPDAGGATISFYNASSGGTCSIALSGFGSLDVASHDFPGLAIGSLEGDGNVSLGVNNLTVGTNDRDTTFAGSVSGDGSLTKVGGGILILSGPNSFAGGTTVSAGTLLAIGKGSATGSGPVLVKEGTLGGTGQLTGPITVGVAGGEVGTLAPGVNGPGRLSTRDTLTFTSSSYYRCDVSAPKGTADQVSAKGVTIYTGAFFIFSAIGRREIALGTTFTIISNTSRNPISGTFDNLPDGSTFTIFRNTYLVNYEGGSGNDLTLTVVPQTQGKL
jgi:autotransporter-associated beta strand protein